MAITFGDETGHEGALKGGFKCIVLHPYIKRSGISLRTPEALLEEGIGLAHAIDLVVVHGEVINLSKPNAGTFLGKGTIERLSEFIWIEPEETDADEQEDSSDEPEQIRKIDVVVIDAKISPIQQRNLERAWDCKVIDRTGLILEIFGARARTKEGKLQVSLAALSYQRGRLVNSWTHLERQRGGAGFMGGPGETQIENDRRQIDSRISLLKKQLEDVKRTRKLHRSTREKVPYPVVALVGYTNAGKSTLFNHLTQSDVEVKDQLFATLDPTMRRLELPSGRTIILSDTVGFVSNLPHELVNAFHATLEEVQSANIIIHVRDSSHPDYEAQKQDVLDVLKDVGLTQDQENDMIEALNKIDLLSDKERQFEENRAERDDKLVPISAVTGLYCDELIETIDRKMTEFYVSIDVSIPYAEGAKLAWLYEHGDVLERTDDENGIHLKVRMEPANAERFKLQ